MPVAGERESVGTGERENVGAGGVEHVADSIPADRARDTRPSPRVPAPATAPAPAPEAVDQAARAILKRAATAYANVNSLKADFVNQRDNPLLGSKSTYRGTLYQKRPDRFLMKFSDPAGDVIVSDGRYFWLYYPSADRRQVLRAPAQTGAAGGVDLQAQFLGDPLTRFTHTYHGTETIGGRRTHVLTLVPRRNMGYRSLKVWIDDRDALVRKFILTENNGLVQEFTLSGLVVNPALSNDLFTFTPPADARVIESP
jgi:outer membrane lipoprotein carrier protein